MGGGTAVGKSTVRKIYSQQYDLNGGTAIVDCDDIKELIPEYAIYKLENVKTAASRVHQESGFIAELLLQGALNKRMNIIFDGTMKDHNWYGKLIKQIKKRGYMVVAVIVHAPLQVALEREAMRAQKTQRFVPREDIVKSHRLVKKSFIQLKPLF